MESVVRRSLLVCVYCIVLSVRLSHCTTNFVTCGSVLKLQHMQLGVRLHSHEVNYGSGSGQQSVTGISHADDVNSYWLVKGPHGKNCERGTPVKCGSVVRLQHLQTQKFLHSHSFSSPLSHNQEVSAFGKGDQDGDEGDNWSVDCSSDYWNRDEAIRLKHTVTGRYLHATGHQFGRPISGQKEISGYASPTQDNLWKAMEGVYLKSDPKAA